MTTPDVENYDAFLPTSTVLSPPNQGYSAPASPMIVKAGPGTNGEIPVPVGVSTITMNWELVASKFQVEFIANNHTVTLRPMDDYAVGTGRWTGQITNYDPGAVLRFTGRSSTTESIRRGTLGVVIIPIPAT